MRARLLWLGLCGTLVTACAKEPRVIPPSVEVAPPLAPVAPQIEPPVVASAGLPSTPLVVVPAPAPAPALVARGLPELARFYDRFDQLLAGQSEQALRVLWLGDSHTAADFMTDPVRLRLAELGGDGGPGFVSLGLDAYRHSALRVEKTGKWRHQPILPAQRTRVSDGVFGYGGQRTIPVDGASARLELRRQPPTEAMRWTLVTRLEPGDTLEVTLGSAVTLVRARGRAGEPAEAQSDLFEGPASAAFSVRHRGGAPEVFGAFVERVRPGVVLDTVGINGARVATPLAWEPAQYEAQVASRKPDLAVLAYGTNEAFDDTSPGRYAEHYRALVGRLRAELPDLTCWIIGAPDAATADGRSISRLAPILAEQEKVARELGCAFTSAQALMGGPGGFQRWLTASPPLARGDRIHLTILGYQTLGRDLGLALIPRAQAAPALQPVQP